LYRGNVIFVRYGLTFLMKKQLLGIFLLLLILPSFAQAQRLRARWKAYRYEWSFGLGASNFLGELGGANQIGTNGFKDLEFSMTRPAVAIGLRYKLTPNFSLHSHLTYGSVKGDDALTEEYFRNNRNLHFRSRIIEANINFEAALLSSREGGIYRLRGVRRSSSFEASAYAFVGIGVFNFDPKAKVGDDWVRLQPLGTEGQDISPAREKYKLTQVCIPIGIGGRYFINRRWGLGLELGVRKTFTDYIDDVSRTYYDNAAIEAKYGPLAAQLADPSISAALAGEPTEAGEQRGDPRDNDAYMFAVFSVHYKLRTGRTNFPIF
jgi:hypothetical protein